MKYMNTIQPIIAAAMLIAAGSINAQDTMELNEKQQALVAIAACEAKGDLTALKNHLNEGFDAGLTVSEQKEALSQLYAYTGFPRSLNALGVLQQVVTERSRSARLLGGRPPTDVRPIRCLRTTMR